MFDPYHKWLGIPKDQRPPTYYQLLGLAFGESDIEVIEEAAIRQSAHLRAYQIGPNAADCTRILNEISKARTTLLDPAKRRQYDQQHAPKPANTAITAQPVAVKASPFDQLESANSNANLVSVKKKTKSGAGLWLGLVAVAMLGIAATIVIVLIMKRGDEGTKPIVQKPQEEKPKPKPIDEKPKPPDDKKPEADLPPVLGSSPRDRVLARADAYWNLGYGGKGAKHPLTTMGTVELRQPATGIGARSGTKVARLEKGYFNAGQAVLAEGEALTLFVRAHDPTGKWNHAIFARRRGPEGVDINFNLAGFADTIMFEMTTDKGAHILRMPLGRIDAKAWHDLLVRYDGEWLQIWCDGTLNAEMPCSGAIKPTTAPVLIGAAADGDNIGWIQTGEMEEAAFWNRALTDGDLLALFRQPQLARAVPDRPVPAGIVEVQPGEVYRSGRQCNFVRMSPDGRYAFFQQTKGITVWDVAENKEVRVLPLTQTPLQAAVSPDGKRFAVGTSTGRAIAWDVESGEQLFDASHGSLITALAFSVDGATLVTGSGQGKQDAAIKLWDGATGARKTLEGLAYPPNSVACTDEVVFAVDALRTLYRIDIASGAVVDKKQLTSFSSHVRFSPDAKQMGYLKSGRIVLWDLKDDKEIRSAALPTDVPLSANGFDITADGRMALVSTVKPPQLMMIDLLKGVTLKTLEGHQQFIRGVAIAPDGKRAFSVDQDKIIRIWKLDDQAAQVAALKPETKPETKVEIKVDPKFIPEWETLKCSSYAALAITPDGRKAVTAGPGVDLWDLTTGTLIRNLLVGGDGAFGSVAISPDGTQALTLSGDNALRLWELSSGRLVQSRPVKVRPHCVAWSPNGQYAAVGGKSISIIDPDSLVTKSAVTSGQEGEVLTVAFSRNGLQVVSGHEKGAIRVGAVTGGGGKTVFNHSQGTAVNQLLTTTTLVLSVGVDKTLRIWDTVGLRQRDSFPHKENLRALAVSPFVTYAVTGGDDRKIRFWNLKTDKVLHIYPGPEGVVRALAFAPNGQFFLSTADDGTLRSWRLPKEIGGK